MNNQRSQTKLATLLTALAFLFASQGCSKEDDPSVLGGAKTSQNQNTVAPKPCTSVCLVAGKNMLVGTVGAAMVGEDLLVTYNVTKPGVFLLEIHLDVFTSEAQLIADGKVKKGNAAPGQFAFKKSFSLGDQKQEYTVTVPKAYLDLKNPEGKDCFFVATHAALSNNETAWGGLCSDTRTGTSVTTARQFSGNNWGVYFQFCKSDCSTTPVAFTYAWEDLNEDGPGNDRDYNDLVIKSSMTQSGKIMTLNFIAAARGAFFDHKFSIKIPKLHITGTVSSPDGPVTVTSDATYHYITVFASTKDALPGVGGSGSFANTSASENCVPLAQRLIVLETDGFDFSTMTYMFEPFITVTPPFQGSVPYDLYIHAVSMAKANGRDDTWVTADGQRYPNGILIPTDWRWPLESMPITSPYPNFTSLTAGFNPLWFNTPDANYLSMTKWCN